jgi:hypothetical protein
VSQPTPNLLSNIGAFKGMAIVPSEIVDDGSIGQEPVGTGPFQFASYTEGSNVVLEANPDYWGEGPFIEGVEFRFIPEGSVAMTNLRAGEVDWTDNIRPAGLLHVSILRSPVAHARITSIDVSQALGSPGVVAAYTGADLAGEWAAPMPMAWQVTDDVLVPDHFPVATDEARYVGDAVAVVVATDAYLAADALEAIDVEYDPLPVVVDLEEALHDERLVHADLETNRCYLYSETFGDIDGVFERADVVVERRYIQQRLLPTAMEPRAVVADPTAATGEVTLYSATQVPHFVRVFGSLVTGIPEHNLRVVAPDVGGGFGSKLDFYAEEPLLIVLARKLGRPLKWTESRSENYQATIHGRDQIQDLSLALDEDGRIRGLKVDLKADMGAYLQLVTPGVPLLGAFMYNAIYKMDAYRFNCTGVFTTKTPTDAYRGAGRPEATYAIERIMDELAVELDMDPLELRRKNWIRAEEFPFTSVAGMTYDSGDYETATQKALELIGYDELRAEQRRRHAVLDEDVHAPRFLRRHVGRDVEALHLARDLAREARRVEARDAGDARGAFERALPGFGNGVADRADDSQPGHHHSTTGHLYLGMRLDVVDGLLHGRDLFRFLVGDLGLEFLLERHHELHGVERVGPQVVDERGVVLDLRLVHAELFCDDFLDALFDVFHALLLPQEGAYFTTYTCRR